jgi:hypothetical protein
MPAKYRYHKPFPGAVPFSGELAETTEVTWQLAEAFNAESAFNRIWTSA